MSVWHRVTDYEGQLHAGNVWCSSPRNLSPQKPAETATQNDVTPPNLHNARLDGGTCNAPNHTPLFGVQDPSASANRFSRRSAAGSNSMRSRGKALCSKLHTFFGVQDPSASANLFSRRSAAGSNSMRSWGKALHAKLHAVVQCS